MKILSNGFLIHARDYQETSSIINIFTADKGIQSLLFKGKYTNKDRFKFSIFKEYSFYYDDKYNLPYLSHFEAINDYDFDKKYYLLGLYINELLYKTLKEGYDFEKIYTHYREFLINLSISSDTLNRLALLFEKTLLQDLGYELTLSEETNLQERQFYDYDINNGFKLSLSRTKDSLSGEELKSFFTNTLSCEVTISNLRVILRRAYKEIFPNINLLGDKLF